MSRVSSFSSSSSSVLAGQVHPGSQDHRRHPPQPHLLLPPPLPLKEIFIFIYLFQVKGPSNKTDDLFLFLELLSPRQVFSFPWVRSLTSPGIDTR